MKKRVIFMLLAALMLLGNIVVTGFAAGSETLHEDDIEQLIAKLPEVSDPMGTEYYFYNQLTDVEKVIYWKINEATWENPLITINGVDGYSEEELNKSAQRAMTALIADDPEYHMYWERYIHAGALSGDTYSYELRKYDISSDYLIRKANARIDEWVATVGQEGDIYSRLRDLIELISHETDYDYSIGLIGDTNITRKKQFNDCILGPLTNDYSVCAGYADVVKVLCDQLNIPCITVGNAGHAWNFVRMDDGKWYSVDATADCLFEVYVDEYNLIGSESVNYQTNYAYHLSELYLASMGDFVFPELAQNEYIYEKTYTAVLHSADNTFDEGTPRFAYQVNEDGASCTIITYEGPQTGDLIIPGSIDGYKVSGIGEAAFFGMDFSGDLIIADTVTSIGDGAFLNCKKLSGELQYSSEIEKIGMLAFHECRNLKGSIILPNSLQYVGAYAFAYCDNLSGDLNIPEGTEIGAGVFSYCPGLNGSLYLPDDMLWDAGQIIGTNLQEIVVNGTNPNYCTVDGILYTKDMKILLSCPGGRTGSVIVAEGVEYISDSAFRECTKISGTLTLPKTLKEIGKKAFLLTGGFVGDLVIPDSVLSIGESAFMDAGFDGALTLPKEIDRIESFAFCGCNFTGDLIIPDSVTHIEEYAFLYCPFGGSLILPEGLRKIGEGAFSTGGFDGYFSNAIDFSDTDVKIANRAFQQRVFPEFTCNCGVEYELNSQFVRCTNCYGGYRHVHNWTDATCETPKTCTECGVMEGETLAHDMGEWEITKEPTCAEDGEKRSDCSRCDHFETEVIEATGHAYESDVTNPTCTEKGYTTHTCACGDSYVDSYVDALGHALGEWAITIEPSCTEEGAEQRDCANCDYGEIHMVSAIGHNYEAVVTGPTCTAKGFTTHTCSNCGGSYEDAYLDELGHNYEKGTCTRCGEKDTTWIPGDIDGNKTVDVDDVLALLWNVLFPNEYPIEAEADFDGNGETDVDDVLTLLWHVLFLDDYPLN